MSPSRFLISADHARCFCSRSSSVDSEILQRRESGSVSVAHRQAGRQAGTKRGWGKVQQNATHQVGHELIVVEVLAVDVGELRQTQVHAGVVLPLRLLRLLLLLLLVPTAVVRAQQALHPLRPLVRALLRHGGG